MFACRHRIKRRARLSAYEKREANERSGAANAAKAAKEAEAQPEPQQRRAPKRAPAPTAKAEASTNKRQKAEEAKKAEKDPKKADKKAAPAKKAEPATQGYKAKPEGGRGTFTHGYAKSADKGLLAQVASMEERLKQMQKDKDELQKAKDKLQDANTELKIKVAEKDTELKNLKEYSNKEQTPKADTIKPGHVQITTEDLENYKASTAVLKHLQGEHDELKRKYDEVSVSSTTKFQEGMDAAYKAMKIAKGLTTPTKGQ